MQEGRSELRLQQLADALALMKQALSLLDQANDADSSGVHLDLAIERLQDLIAASSPDDSLNS